MARAREFLEIMAVYRKSEDLINIGAYARGSNPKIDKAIAMIDGLDGYLCQQVEEKTSLTNSAKDLAALISK